MKIIVISDTHGRADNVDTVINMHKNADVLLFLGDGLRDMFGREHLHRGGVFAAVKGNCDEVSLFNTSDIPDEHLINLGEYTVLMMHGHKYGVKYGTEAAVERAAMLGADLLLYGHTHVPEERYIPDGARVGGVVLEKPLRVFNPGSLGAPRDRYPSYGLIDTKGKNILLSHGKIK